MCKTVVLRQRTVGLSENNPALSCTQILNTSKSTAPSGEYWLQDSNGSVIQVFCDMTLFPCQTGFREEDATCKSKPILALKELIWELINIRHTSHALTASQCNSWSQRGACARLSLGRRVWGGGAGHEMTCKGYNNYLQHMWISTSISGSLLAYVNLATWEME